MTAFKAIVDKHFGPISQRLQDAPAPRPGAPPQVAAGADAPSDEAGPDEVAVPADLQAPLGAGSVFIDGGAAPSRVFHIYSRGEREPRASYRYERTITSGDAAGDFIGAAYAAILGRRADGAGSRNYTSALEGGFLSREEILRMLASSDEARMRGTALAIVPHASAWLSSHGSLPRGLRLAAGAPA